MALLKVILKQSPQSGWEWVLNSFECLFVGTEMEEPTQKQHKLDQLVTERCFILELQYVKFQHSKKKNVFKFIKSFHTGLNLHSDLILISNGVMNWSWSRNTSCHSSKKHSVSFRTQLLLKPSCKKQLVLYFISVWCNSVMKDCLCNAYFYIIHVVGGE